VGGVGCDDRFDGLCFDADRSVVGDVGLDGGEGVALGLGLFAFAEGGFGIESGFEDFGFVGEFYCLWGGDAEDAGAGDAVVVVGEWRDDEHGDGWGDGFVINRTN
jgi:hypothetical protein